MSGQTGDNNPAAAANTPRRKGARILLWATGIVLGLVCAVPALFYALVLYARHSETNPPSAQMQVDASPSGIAALFERECLEQTSVQWLQNHIRQRIDDCDSLLNKLLLDGDDIEECKLATSESWPVPTSTGESLWVAVDLPYLGNNIISSPATCRILIEENLARSLQPLVKEKIVNGTWQDTFLVPPRDYGSIWELAYMRP